MSTANLPAPIVRPDPPHAPPAVAVPDLVAAFLAGRKPTTIDAYRRDLADFARFLGVATPGAAAELLVGGTPGQANALALGYRAAMAGRGLSPATQARRLAALRSVVEIARTVGRIAWGLEVEAPKVETFRDTAGPGDAGWRSVLETAKAAAAGGTPRAVRDLAIVRLLHDRGLRRGEGASLDLAVFDAQAGTLAILG